MCGLFGARLNHNYPPDVECARKSRDSLTHRGPDKAGEWLDDNLYIGHRRLSIIDLSDAGDQPMISSDGNVIITVNGEIYNFNTLRDELEIEGCVFQSKSDSEVILHGYQYWGIDTLVRRLDGMYAAVIYDRNTQQLYAFRDRVGIKPFYYYHCGNNFSWGSELKSLETWLPADQLQKDNEALYDFLTYRYIPAPKTLYRNIYKLPPAHFLSYNLRSNAFHLQRYWHLNVFERKDMDHTAMAEKLAMLTQKHVKEQMVSDVSVGFLLSGGLDSSVITLAGANVSSHPMTFSIGFTNPDRDESPYAEEVAILAQTEHHMQKFQDEEMTDLPVRMKKWFDEPFGDTSAIPTYRVCALAREHVTVALSGDGGDELFGGYAWYKRFAYNRKLPQMMPFLFPQLGLTFFSKYRPLAIATTRDPVVQYAYIRGALFGDSLRAWAKELEIPNDYDQFWAYRAHFDANLPIKKAAQVMDFHTYLPDDILTKVDRVSMATSLECRPPFLACEMVEFAFSLPANFLYKNKTLKGGMKEAFSSQLPERLLKRRKQGFSVPDTGWKGNLTGAGKQMVQEVLLREFLL